MPRYECDTCTKTFKVKKLLDDHMDICLTEKVKTERVSSEQMEVDNVIEQLRDIMNYDDPINPGPPLEVQISKIGELELIIKELRIEAETQPGKIGNVYTEMVRIVMNRKRIELNIEKNNKLLAIMEREGKYDHLDPIIVMIYQQYKINTIQYTNELNLNTLEMDMTIKLLDYHNLKKDHLHFVLEEYEKDLEKNKKDLTDYKKNYNKKKRY